METLLHTTSDHSSPVAVKMRLSRSKRSDAVISDEVLGDFLDFVTSYSYYSTPERYHPNRYEHRGKIIGRGQNGIVRLLTEDLVVKTYQKSQQPASAYNRGFIELMPNAFTELAVMEKIRTRLAYKDPGIFVPKTYAAQKFTNTKSRSLLQERLPSDAKSLRGLALGHDTREMFASIAETVANRIHSALGYSLLRAAAGDVSGGGMFSSAIINPSNVLINSTFDPEGTLYIIDVIGRRRMRAAGARILSVGHLL